MSTNARGGNQGFTIRGIGGNRVLHVVDGVRGSDIYYGNGKDSFEMDNLQSVQIVRGPHRSIRRRCYGGSRNFHNQECT